MLLFQGSGYSKSCRTAAPSTPAYGANDSAISFRLLAANTLHQAESLDLNTRRAITQLLTLSDYRRRIAPPFQVLYTHAPLTLV